MDKLKMIEQIIKEYYKDEKGTIHSGDCIYRIKQILEKDGNNNELLAKLKEIRKREG